MSELLNQISMYLKMEDILNSENMIPIENVKELIDELQQKENIINEVREYIKKYRTMVDGYEDEKTGQMIYEHRLKLNKHQVRHLLEILDKENK